MSGLFGNSSPTGGGTPHIAKREYDTEDEFVITIDLYGYEKDDIVAKKGGNRIEVRAENSELGTFERQFVPPSRADLNEIQAKFQNGVLTIRVPVANEEII